MAPAEVRIKYPRKYVKLLDFVHAITNRATGGVAIGGITLAFHAETFDKSLHIYLVVIGYVLLMSQAVVAMNPASGWAKEFKYETKMKIHSALQITGTILAVAGSLWATLRLSNKNPYRTTHGIMGLTTLSFTLLSLVVGCLQFWKKFQIPLVKVCHSALGFITMTSVFTTYILGVRKYYPKDSNAVSMYIYLAVMSIVGILTPPLMNTIRRVKNNR